MNKPLSVDFQFSIKQRGRGAKKRMVEGEGEVKQASPPLQRVPRISRYMALAIHFEDLIRQGVVTDYAELARLGYVTRARVTQIMNLRLLAPEIQEELLFLEWDPDSREQNQLKSLQAVAAQLDWQAQRRLWERHR